MNKAIKLLALYYWHEHHQISMTIDNNTTILSSGSGGSLCAVFTDCTTAHIDELRFVR